MALPSQSKSGGSEVWWSSWISSAKEKSVSVLSATKRDLAEFVTVLGSDTKAAVKGASDNINKILSTPLDEEDGDQKDSNGQRTSASPLVEAETTPYDRCQAELLAIQRNTETYLQDPSQSREGDYDEWKSSFDIQSYQNDISSLLVSCSHVRTMHSQLVPAKVSYEAFWMRYFYKIQQLKKEERKRADLMARASNRSQEQLQWDEEVDDALGSPLLFKMGGNGHQRSESSTDSFVCVSEETGLEGEGPPSRDVAESESWEQLGSDLGSSGSRNSRAKLSEEDEGSGGGGGGGGGGGMENLLKEKESLLRSIEMITEKDIKGKPEDADSSSSDWEKWDD